MPQRIQRRRLKGWTMPKGSVGARRRTSGGDVNACEQCADNWPDPCGDHDPACADVHAVQDQWAHEWAQSTRQGMC